MSRLCSRSVSVLVSIRPLVVAIACSDPKLARRLGRAASGAVLNLRRARRARGRARWQRQVAAVVAAREAASCLGAAQALGFVAPPARLAARLSRVIGALTLSVLSAP